MRMEEQRNTELEAKEEILLTNYERVRDGVGYLKEAEEKLETPTLFDFMD